MMMMYCIVRFFAPYKYSYLLTLIYLLIMMTTMKNIMPFVQLSMAFICTRIV